MPRKAPIPQFDKKIFTFETTDELEDLKNFIGQNRAMEAIEFGIHIQRTGYNIYALGTPGVGKRSVIERILENTAPKQPTPPDICYIHNFDDPQKPLAVLLPSGMGRILRQDMDNLVEDLTISIPSIFENEEYRLQMKKISDEYSGKQEKIFKQLEEDAKKENLVILSTAQGFVVAPSSEGKVLSAEAYDKLSEEEKKSNEILIKKFTERLTEIIKQFPRIQRERRNREKEVQKDMTMSVVGSIIDELRKKYQDIPRLQNYFQNVQEDVVLNVKDFLKPEEQMPSLYIGLETKPSFVRYKINLLVDNSDQKGAPIIHEQNPNYNNLVGRVEHVTQYGTLITNFSLIRSGALHHANGGYLILDMLRLLSEPFVWEALKRVLYSKSIAIEPPPQLSSYISTVSLQPEPIPADLKIILIGDRFIFYLLVDYDPDFNELFKVAAEFSEDIPLNAENCLLFARLIATLIRRNELRPFNRDAMIKLLQQSSRWIGDSQRISIHMRSINDLLKESDYFASLSQKKVVDEKAIKKAISSQIKRLDKIREEFYEDIQRNKIIIETRSKKIGQINALSLAQINGFYFGFPIRVTAQVRVGKGDVLDIQREVDLSGAMHSKGVLTLAGFLGGRYSRNLLFSISASLAFEQTYALIEGDSASAAELCALISALSDVPIDQSIAITGSVDQYGNIQAVGGISQKIEGFYDICKQSKLTGKQGVIIPNSNVDNLVLRDDVAQAIKDKKFTLYAIEHIDEALETLMHTKAGIRNKSGHYPKNTINNLVEENLKLFYKKAHNIK